MTQFGNQDLQMSQHLIWDLDDFENHQRAASFVKQFQDTLCVYSGFVEQLYTNYDVSLPRDMEKSLIILPNPYAFHDTYSRINEEAVRSTNFVIMPGELAGGKGLHIRIPFNNRKARTVPLANGLRAIMRAYEDQEDYFLPVITKGDLRAFRRDLPVLHLHRFLPSRLKNSSRLDANTMRKAILYRLTPYLA
jgi:hypothetical protein